MPCESYTNHQRLGRHFAHPTWLFCDPVGPNLRNELAHGLISLRLTQFDS
ncbi:MAG: DUF4209 domain-containing protein [Thioploca sp.]|nr:DUF4209 domain-containing protein [Thioploca sp.]